MTDFKVNDRVVRQWSRYNSDHDNINRGTVIADSRKDPLSGKDRIYVKWDSTWYKPNPEEVLVSSLMLESEADKQLSVLDKEFERMEVEVSDKMRQAASLIREAGELAGKVGVDSLQEMYDAIRPLYQAMDSTGWNSSSFSC